MAITKLAYKIAFKRRYKQLLRYATETPELQEKQFRWLVSKGATTLFGKEYGITADMSIEEFAQKVPIMAYDQQKRYIEQMLQGEEDILWPGLCKWFAKSSGTTSDKSKYIPITQDALRKTHMRGSTDAMVVYLALNPTSRVLEDSGKGLILGGSFAEESFPKGIKAGDLSATLIQNVRPIVNYLRTPSKEIALMPEWESKLKAITEATMDVNVTSISGVPSWMMGVLKEVLRTKGVTDISDVWPNLEVFFHGGIAFGPYREQYKQLISSPYMHYLETYNASEGFFGVQSSWDDNAMQLVVDNGIFYEFIPMDEFVEPTEGTEGSVMHAVPLKDIEVGKNYAMVITTPGLWRYLIGDTVKFTQKDPYKFVISGRTKAFINAFGEELMVSNADEALEKTCRELDCEISDYTAGPTFAEAKSGAKARHTWVIEFSKAPQNPEQFADVLDQHLQHVNSDYEAKRYKGIFLDRLELIVAPQGTFNLWLKQKKGKLGGQIKIPRLSNSRQYIEEIQDLIRR